MPADPYTPPPMLLASARSADHRFRSPLRARARGTRAYLAMLGAGLVLGGCYKPLFPQREPRTQFQTYETMRGDAAPVQEADVFGNPQPALRERLVR